MTLKRVCPITLIWTARFVKSRDKMAQILSDFTQDAGCVYIRICLCMFCRKLSYDFPKVFTSIGNVKKAFSSYMSQQNYVAVLLRLIFGAKLFTLDRLMRLIAPL